MYSLVRRFIKTAVAFLAVGLALGTWMLVRRELYGVHPSPYETSAHTHVIFVGFVMMMILGVALWLFPRPEKGDTRYDPRAAELAYWLVTVGTGGRSTSGSRTAPGVVMRRSARPRVPRREAGPSIVRQMLYANV